MCVRACAGVRVCDVCIGGVEVRGRVCVYYGGVGGICMCRPGCECGVCGI